MNTRSEAAVENLGQFYSKTTFNNILFVFRELIRFTSKSGDCMVRMRTKILAFRFAGVGINRLLNE